MESDPDVAFGIRSHLSRDRSLDRNRVFIEFARRGIDAAELIEGIFHEPYFAVTCDGHPIRGCVLLRLYAGWNLPHVELPGFWIQADDLIAPDITEPHGSVRMDAHGVSSTVAILELRHREHIERFRCQVVVQPTAIGTAIDQPEFVVWTSHNSIQPNFLGGSRRRLQFCIREGLGVEPSQAAAGPLGQPAISLIINRKLVRLDIGFRQLKFHSNVFCGVAFIRVLGKRLFGSTGCLARRPRASASEKLARR